MSYERATSRSNPVTPQSPPRSRAQAKRSVAEGTRRSTRKSRLSSRPSSAGQTESRRVQDSLSQIAAYQRIDAPLLVILLLMVCFGLIMLFSASLSVSYADSGDSLSYITKQAGITLAGVVIALVIAYFVPVSFFNRPIIILGLYFVTTALLLLVKVVGINRNNAVRWMSIAGIQFQPSEIAKLSAVLCLAGYFSFISSQRRKGAFSKKTRLGQFLFDGFLDLLLPGLAMGLWLVLILTQPHLSGFIILSLVVLVVFIFAAIPPRSWLSGILQALPLLIVGVLLLTLLAPVLFKGKSLGEFAAAKFAHVGRRLDIYNTPEEVSADDRLQVEQATIALGSGGLTGVGLGMGRQKFNFLPEAHNDYIFPIIGEELGFLGALSVILLFLLFLIFGMRIAFRARSSFCSILAAGYVFLITLQALFNMGVATKLLPATGISLPFFSYGGTSNFFFLIACGMILCVSKSGQQTNPELRELLEKKPSRRKARQRAVESTR